MDVTLDRRLAEVSAHWDLLKHPFYQRWVAGDLTRAELVYYTGQYAHVVRAIPQWLATAAEGDSQNSMDLRRHADEEFEHVALWEKFAASLGVERDELNAVAPNPATSRMIARCDELACQGQGAAVVWSIEAQSPGVSVAKLEGLRAHYGIDETSGGEYFAVHQTLDEQHEVQLRNQLSSQSLADRSGVTLAAEATLEGLWDLLTSCQAAA